MSRRLVTRAVGAAVALAALVALWWFLAPPQVGGRTAWAVVEGTSMEPRLGAGDLVLVRARPSYDVDDVVLFESESLAGAHVLHRIVGTDAGRFVTRGDNRTQDDPDLVAGDAVTGRLWLTIPAVGSVLQWLGRPLPIAVVLFAFVFTLLVGGRELSRQRPAAAAQSVRPAPGSESSRDWGSGSLGPAAGSLLAAAAVAVALFAGLAVLSWSRPLTERVTVEDAFAHTGAFAYDAKVRRSTVYPAGRIETGQAVFRRLADRLRVEFDYRFTSIERASLRGGIGLEAVVSDGQGWSRPMLVVPAKPFAGARAHVEGLLDLRRLERAVTRMRSLTKTAPSAFEVAVTPLVQVAGYSGSTLIDTSFEPALTFSYDGGALRLRPPVDGETSLRPSVPGTTTHVVETTVGPAVVSLPTGDARTFAAVGLLVSLLLVSASAAFLWRRARAGGPAMLHARYGNRIVAADVVVPEGRWISDVRDAETLGVIAEHYDRVILHAVEHGDDVYLVDDGVAVYRYRAAAASPLTTPSPSPAAGT